ncbi:MAG: DUF3187 family protein [Gammaproteobacteria bacterium]|nr:DUF3187 family protein [Gammaproteobacteria bacterium]
MRRIALSCISVFVCLSSAAAEQVLDAYPLRSHNPFLQVFGLPAFQTPELVAAGRTEFGFNLDIVNDMEEADRGGEVLTIDSESTIVNLSLRRGFGERYEFGIDIPYISHDSGFLDSVIYNFHDVVGLSNSTRDGPEDQFRFYFERQGQVYVDESAPLSGVGDVQLSAAMAFDKVTLRAGLKLPTGDPDKLTGSGATDVSLGAYAAGRTLFLAKELGYTGFLGVLALGQGEVLADLQRDLVPYAGLGLRWHATERFSIATQWYVQGSYYDAHLDELGGTTVQMAFGGDFHFPKQKLLLRLAIAEDLAAATAPDFALHLSLRKY